MQLVFEHAVYNLTANVETRLDGMDRADWCSYGDPLYAKDGRLFRLAVAGGELRPTEEARPLIDLSGRASVAKESPESAKLWGG